MLEVGYAVVDSTGVLRGAVINNLEYVRGRLAKYRIAHPELTFEVHPVFVGGPLPAKTLPPITPIRGDNPM